MNREHRAALLLMHQAAADALRASLEADAEKEHQEHGVAASWRMAPATVSASIAHDRVAITDPQAFLRYLKTMYPDEIVSVLQPRSSKWVGLVRNGLIQFVERDPETKKTTGRIVMPDGTVVPGVAYERGGRFLSASIKSNTQHALVLAEAARYAVRTGEWAPLWAYTDEADPEIVLAMLEEHPDGPPAPDLSTGVSTDTESAG